MCGCDLSGAYDLFKYYSVLQTISHIKARSLMKASRVDMPQVCRGEHRDYITRQTNRVYSYLMCLYSTVGRNHKIMPHHGLFLKMSKQSKILTINQRILWLIISSLHPLIEHFSQTRFIIQGYNLQNMLNPLQQSTWASFNKQPSCD